MKKKRLVKSLEWLTQEVDDVIVFLQQRRNKCGYFDIIERWRVEFDMQLLIHDVLWS